MLLDQLDVLMEPIIKLYRDFEEAVILDIIRRLVKMGKVTDTAAWQLNRLQQSGLAYDAAIERISKLTGLSEIELKTLFKKAGVQSIEFDNKLYKLAGLNPKQVSPAMAEVFQIGLQKTNGILRNLTRTTAMDVQNLFIDVVDTAYQEVITGAFSYDQAIRQAVTNLADKGINAVSYVNRVDFMETAVRRAVLTGVSNTAMQLQLKRAEEMGTDLMSVSAHIGARNKGEGPMNHESWQGQVYSISGTSTKYKPLFATTGLGTGEGLGGYNCRHSMYPFFEGISQNVYDQAVLDEYANKTVTYNGREMSVYEASQYQRQLERKIRGWKRREAALEAIGQIYTSEGVQALNKVSYWQRVMRDFLKQTGLSRQSIREQL